MRVKRFVGNSVSDTMAKIKRELGSEAVILQTRHIKEGGLFGFFARTKVEITAAIEDKPVNILSPDFKTELPLNRNYIKEAYETYRVKENKSLLREPEDKKNSLLEHTHTELKEMHNILKEIKGRIAKIEEQNGNGEPMDNWVQFLVEKGISLETARELIACQKEEVRSEEWEQPEFVLNRLRSQLEKICSNTEVIRPQKKETKVVALVGPTGVGKTTTIGKLAAGFSIIERRKVALITADTYRVAAVEQLKTFGEIIGVPVEVVMTPESLGQAIDKHRDKELIFIDTAGRSPNHGLHMSELEAFIEVAKPDLTMLVMSITTNLTDQLLIYKRFKDLSTHLIFTKLDESYNLGSMLDLIMKTNLPVAYLTTGQNVPDDIEVATPEKLVNCILGRGS
ncbi:MAG: flagellar biosynthesis protein FlhF [Desulfitobacteriia bacterium]|jgi:flagellar biosynthesis protein FlhF